MRYEFASPSAIPVGFWRWPHVDPEREWADRMSGKLVVVPEFLDLFERLRSSVGFALPITSGYRTPEHNVVVSTTGENGPHPQARACDIQIYGERAVRLIAAAQGLGFTGFGFGQDLNLSPNRRYLHLDNLTAAEGFPRPNLWSY
jgi:zinc D-Ala-D-Ala carboxypeptidase